MHRTNATISIALSLFFGLAACGGGDDDGGGADGGGGGGDLDGGGGGDVDAAPDGVAGLGQVCDPADQSSCPADFACLQLQGGSSPWCSTPCTMAGMLDPACTDAYDGPGQPGCFLSVMPEGGGQSQNVCAILCTAPQGAGCTTCDGTCPDGLTCGTPDGNGYALCG